MRFRGKPHHIGRTDLIPLSVAREEARKLLLGLLRGKQLTGSRKTMADLGTEYLRRHARPHKAARSAEEDERMWQRSVLPALGDRLVHEVTAEQVQDLHVAMARTPFAANRVLALLSKAFNLAGAGESEAPTPREASSATRSLLVAATSAAESTAASARPSLGHAATPPYLNLPSPPSNC